MEKYTNDLIKETSPYLLQHAHNPVNWVPWSNEAFELAKSENKLVLVSIGYSACHWCHVMEHECFEDEEVATWMNRYFVCIKVDREERPDVDQVYMSAVQLMTQRGGWPLNCFTLPDGRPIYGGTYFPKEQWIQVLKSLEHTYKNRLTEVLEYADKLQQGISQSELIDVAQEIPAFNLAHIDELVLRWKHSFDTREGGNNRAPKFPLPSNLEFLLYYGVRKKDDSVLKQVYLTLDKMAFGGIFDHIAGGFCRYSVDVLWKVPHFEKMLYDNAQLVSVYAQAYQYTKNPTYKEIAQKTLSWAEHELMTAEFAFQSALDADSEGEEGKYYCWSEEELKEELGTLFPFAQYYYQVSQIGYWEDEKYILLRRNHDVEVAKELGLDLAELKDNITQVNSILGVKRSKRIRPGLDTKCLTSWNAMLLKAFCDAYKAFGEKRYVHLAEKNAQWILQHQLKNETQLYHNYNQGVSSIDGFLEDYAHVIAAFIALYQVNFDDFYIQKALDVSMYVLEEFSHESSGMFYFTPQNHQLIARKMEINDNVIPSTNSVMARNLFELGTILHRDDLIDRSKQLLANIWDGMESYGSGYSNWALVALHLTFGIKELAVLGPDWKSNLAKLQEKYHVSCVFTGGLSTLPPTLVGKDKTKNGIYICENKTCGLPQEDVVQVLNEMG